MKGKWFFVRLAMLLSALGVVAVGSVSSASARTAPQHKALSQSTVSILANPCAGDYVFEWLANKLGYFSQQGLTVTQQLPVGITSSVLFPEFLAGTANFAVGGVTTYLPLRAGGGAMIAIAQQDASPILQIAVQPAVATALHLPTSSNNIKQVEAQLTALKGSHLVLGISGYPSIGTTELGIAASKVGFTFGLNAPTDDIDMVNLGSVTAMTAAFAANKVQGIFGIPTYTFGPWPVINVGDFSKVSNLLLFTSPAFITAHPDSVQAFVNAVALAYKYAKLHPSGASKLLNSLETYCGFPNPQQDVYLNADFLTTEPTPVLTPKVWADDLTTYNTGFLAGGLPADHVSYATAYDAKFMAKAVKTYNIKQPNWAA